MAFSTFRAAKCFPELFGFVLLDPERLDAFFNGKAAGQNLLERFTETDDGDRVVAEGIAIPLMHVEAGYYTVIVRHATASGIDAKPCIQSDGWVLGTNTGTLLLCGIGYLTCWDPHHPRYEQVSIDRGWYEVEVRGFLAEPSADEDGTYEFILTPAMMRPQFMARLDQRFSLLDGT